MRILVVKITAAAAGVAKVLREAGYAVDATGDGDEGLWYATGNDYE